MSHDHEYCYEDEENERSLTPYGDDGDDDFEDDDDFDDQFDIDFANPGSNSALRAASRSNPRNLPCPDLRRAQPAHAQGPEVGLSVRRVR